MVTDLVLAFAAGLVIATLTAPVGVSGAVFMLPIQLTVLSVPNPAVTATNLLYNVIASPGALFRYRRSGRVSGPLTRLLLAGTVPGVVAGAVVRVFLLPGPRAFRVIAGLILLSLGLWLVWRTRSRRRPRHPLTRRAVFALSLAVGVVGGVYGIGGGSILSPLLVGSGMTVAVVAPAALASTFLTSVIGACTFAVLALLTDGTIAPYWEIGVACGLGGLVGGYLGARLQPRLPERTLRLLLGCMAISIGVLYLVQGIA
ncbi:TSUP family transporter [Nocardioides gilvus]|uniref:TSUP family transporter n=1 Tax=Nocardioides gilvus TaxID=1735589 RepID=UPI001951147B|nr:TSUP family transporter [Nocardioides gilvus]